MFGGVQDRGSNEPGSPYNPRRMDVEIDLCSQHISQDHKPFFEETVMCEHCLAPFMSLEDLKQVGISFLTEPLRHNWRIA